MSQPTDTSAEQPSNDRISDMETEGEDEEENPFSSPREVYGRLIEIVNNECLVEEMLPFEETVLECILEQMRHMSEGLERVGPRLGSFVVEQHKIELERFAFMVNKYYRTRLTKLELKCNQFVRLLRRDPKQACQLLSTLEIKYLDNYVTSVDTYLDNVLLNKMPANLNTFKLGNVPNDPSSGDNEYVFVKCNAATSVTINDPVTGQEIVPMDENEQHFLPFSALKPHFQKGSANLHIL